MKYFLDEKGVALPLVLMILFILTLLGTTIFVFNMTETKQVALTEDQMKAHYVARSGAHAVVAYLIENPEKTGELVNATKNNGEAAKKFGDGEFAVGVEFPVDNNGNPIPNEVHVRSTGIVNGAEQRVLAIVRDVGTDFPLFGDTIGFQGEPTGTAITGGNVFYRTANNINNQDIVVDGDIIQLDRTFPPVVLPCQDDGSPFYGSCPDPDQWYDNQNKELVDNNTAVETVFGSQQGNWDVLKIDQSMGFGDGTSYGNISMHGSDRMFIDAAAGDNILVKANEIDMSNNSLYVHLNNNIVAVVVDEFDSDDIHMAGSGHLVFYVNNWICSGNFIVNSESDDVTLNVFVTADGLFDMRGTPNFSGTIYAPDAEFSQSGSGNTKDDASLTGWVIANEFTGGSGMVLDFYPYELPETGLDLNFLRLEEWHDLGR